MSSYPPPPDLLTGSVAWVFGDDFDIDLVVGVANIKSYDPAHLRAVCMADIDTGFVDRVRAGDIVVGGRNFGYGHPHYPPMVALRNLGISAVIAESFSPGFWRGETFNGMPLLTVPGISSFVATGDSVTVDWRTATVATPDGRNLVGTPPSPRTIAVVEAGGAYQLLLQEHSSAQQGQRA